MGLVPLVAPSTCPAKARQPIAGNRAVGRTFRQPRRLGPAHTNAHTTSARRFESLSTRTIALLGPGALAHCISSPFSACPAAAALQSRPLQLRPTQPSQAPSHSIDCSFQRCAALRSCLTRQAPAPHPNIPARLPHGSHAAAPLAHPPSYHQHGRSVSVAFNHQT